MLKIQVTKPFHFILLTLIILVILFVILFNYFWGKPQLLISGEFTITEGSSASQTWSRLVDSGYLTRTMPLYFYSWKQNAANNIKSGTYPLQRGEHVKEVILRFVSGDATSKELTITYPEGFTLKQMAARTAAQEIGTIETFMSSSKPSNYVNQFPILKNIPTERDLEGYLFPDTYRVFIDDEPKNVIQRMLANFNEKFSQELRNEATAGGHTIDQIIIMASIVEREVLTDKDMAMIAGILWKRLDDGVGLDADATVRYALDKWDKPLTVQDLANDSPYNTRKWRGLPPGPISNPGLRSLQAAVRPESSEYYYYLSAPSGQTIFSRNLAEHNENKAKYLR